MSGWKIDIISVQTVQLAYKLCHPADVYAIWVDISKAERLLVWRPQALYRKGIKCLVQWYQENQVWAIDVA